MNYYRTPVLKSDPKSLKGSQVKLSKFLGSSDDWFSDKNMITFDFFVEWDKDNSYSSPLNKNIFIKRCVNKQFYDHFEKYDFNSSPKDQIKFNDVFNEVNVLQEKISNLAVSNANLLLFKEEEYKDNMKITLVESLNKNATSKAITLDNLKSSVYSMSGNKDIFMGTKGLIYATTELERGLSKTNTVWAGDCDALCLNENNEPLFIIEYQKISTDEMVEFNKSSHINYLVESKEKNQEKKFKRLLILSENISKEKVPLIVLHYPTSQYINKFVFEIIDRNGNNIVSKKRVEVPFGLIREDTFDNLYKSIQKEVNNLNLSIPVVNRIKP